MSGKCEWKDGKFYPCDKFSGKILQNTYEASFKPDGYMVLQKPKEACCASCGADIRKPELEKPLIVKSGGTWVAHFEGVDYLWTAQSKLNIEHEQRLVLESGLFSHAFKPFSEIEKEGLTDEIAKLRPMVMHSMTPKQLDMLYGVNGGYAIVLYRDPYSFVDSDYSIDSFHLATPKELQELA